MKIHNSQGKPNENRTKITRSHQPNWQKLRRQSIPSVGKDCGRSGGGAAVPLIHSWWNFGEIILENSYYLVKSKRYRTPTALTIPLPSMWPGGTLAHGYQLCGQDWTNGDVVHKERNGVEKMNPLHASHADEAWNRKAEWKEAKSENIPYVSIYIHSRTGNAKQ